MNIDFSYSYEMQAFYEAKRQMMASMFPYMDEDWIAEKIHEVVMSSEDPTNIDELNMHFESMMMSLAEFYSPVQPYPVAPPPPPPPYKITHMVPSRYGQGSERLDYLFSLASSKFYEMQHEDNYMMKIDSIDYIENEYLEQRFKSKMAEFQRLKIPSNYIWTLHGTYVDNMDSIFANNFNLDKIRRTRYGFGIYFSEQPEVSIDYSRDSNSVILCKVLLGRPGINSKEISPDEFRRCFAVIIGETDGVRDPSTVDQILPCFVINYY